MNQDDLKRAVEYDPGSGVFRRKESGAVAGCKDSHGYIVFKIGKKMYKAHRLAFLYMTGQLPRGDVDHIDLDRANNRWSNLREATRRQNNVNIKGAKSSKSRFLGVSFAKSHKKWTARIRTKGGRKFLGYFDCEVAAAMAYHLAAKKEHGEFARGNPEAEALIRREA